MATDRPAALDPPPRPRRTPRGRLGIAMVLGCLAVMPTLTLLSARSYSVEEQVVSGRDSVTFDPRAATASIESRHLKIDSSSGVVGFAWETHSWADNRVLGFDFAEIQARQAQLGWSLRHTTTTGKPRPFGRSREGVGPWRTLHWDHWSGPEWRLSASGAGISEHWGIAVPYWLLILPGAGPVVWWLWCPPGRAFPRLTIGRLALATAALGAVLGGLASFERSTTTDRALGVLAEFGGSWTYGPDPGGSGRSVVTRIAFAKTGNSRFLTDAEMPRIRSALAQCPQIQSIKFAPLGIKLTAAGIAQIADQLDIPTVDLTGLPVNDSTLALLRDHRRIRMLGIGWTNVTDAGLAHLATLPALQNLYLDGLPITDPGLKHLVNIPRLQFVSLTYGGVRGKITEAAARGLLDSIPTLDRIGLPGGSVVDRARAAATIAGPDPR